MAVHNDGDLGVYLHQSLKGWDRKRKLPTSGSGVTKMGSTLHWDEFAILDRHGNPVQGWQDPSRRGRISFGESWNSVMASIHDQQAVLPPYTVAEMSRNSGVFDIKEQYGHFTGRKVTLIGVGEVFMSAKSVGNFMVGHYAGFGGIDLHTIMNLAGALQQKQWHGLSTFTDVVRGREFGPPPYYGETDYAGRNIELGYRYGRMERGYRMR